MKRTGAGVLVLTGAIGAAAGFLFDQMLTASGRPTFVPGVTLPILLVLLGGFVIVLALPIRRATRGTTGARPVDPFRALRIAMLAKASSIVGRRVRGIRRRARALPPDPAGDAVGRLVGRRDRDDRVRRAARGRRPRGRAPVHHPEGR